MKFTKALLGIAMAGVFCLSLPTKSHAIAVTWDLLDHGDGGLGEFYGLRLDDPHPSTDKRLFSFGGDSTAALVFNTAGGGSASISGTIIENGNGETPACTVGSTPHSPGDCDVWQLEYTIGDIDVMDVNDALAGFTGESGSGSVTRLSDNFVLQLGFKLNGDGDAFLWLPDGDRIDNDKTTLSGRGWVDPKLTSSGANDFLFRGRLVPEPGALALFGIGLIGLGVLRWRRKAA